MAERADEDDQDRLPRPRRGRGRDARRDRRRRGRRGASSRSTSRRASSRRSCAAAHFTEVPDITARICGICPVAYQMSSVQAMEQICGVEVDGQLRALRRLLYCGEWIESHALHVFMLHAPDFLGYESAIELARDNPELVAQALELKKTGNEVMTVVGGREVHPINVTRRRLVPRAAQARARAARREARAGARDRARGGARHRGLRLPRLRAGLRARRARPAGRVPDRPRPDRLEPRASTSPSPSTTSTSSRSTSPGRTRSTRACVERGSYLCGPLARFALVRRPALAARPGGRRRGRARAVRAQPVPQHRRARRRARLRGRRGAAADRRLRGAGRAGGRVSSRAPASATAAPRRRAASSTTATRSTTRARSSTRRSCRRPRRTSGRSRRTCAAWSSARSTCPDDELDAALRADDPQLRSLHLVRDPLPEARGRAALRVVCVGNAWRGDDAAGLEVARAAARDAAAGASRCSNARASRRR